MENLTLTFGLFPTLLFLLLGGVVGIVAGLFGVGGGLVVVPALIWGLPLVGVEASLVVHIAVGTSLTTIVFTSLAAIRAHQKRGAVLWDYVLRLTPGILVGSWLGGIAAGAMDAIMLQRVFGAFAVLVALRMFFLGNSSSAYRLTQAWLMTLAGSCIGLVSAIVGIGGGTMTVPLLHAGGVEMRKAVATSSACGLPIALAGAASFAITGWAVEGLPAGSTGYLYWPVGLIIVMTSVLTAPFGAALAHRLPAAILKRVFAIFLLLMGIRLLLG
ncbi:MAG: sulfite exporter TauE/SafE family protein [endosymbiont of Seepiophila jonesi]|uniref:Probable membrane transporter protein n=1 Tax=endosymbiont of Lamellibrachia luymesi TaxID=2200907 RepID=A0A370DVX7_9GAMM|nr:MAG: sulfite exporter TauE/SafE family protein [endosymbiont of Lamellibrachia luymesi]RDH92795.1 MAG: sulfite exporter TauE/SafE family protein [endosymbiont of Seepiophila jonesi]